MADGYNDRVVLDERGKAIPPPKRKNQAIDLPWIPPGFIFRKKIIRVSVPLEEVPRPSPVEGFAARQCTKETFALSHPRTPCLRRQPGP